MNQRPTIKRILSAGVMVQVAVLLCSVPLRAQSSPSNGPPSSQGGANQGLAPGLDADPKVGGPAGEAGFNNFEQEQPKPEAHVLSADHAPGTVSGVTRYAHGLPMPGAKVVILDADIDVEKTAVSGADGTYEFKGLKPGQYQISADMDGFMPSRVTTVQVAPGKAIKYDVTLGENRSTALHTTSAGPALSPVSLRVGAGDPAESPAAATVSATGLASSPSPAAQPAAAATAAAPASVTDQLATLQQRYDNLEARFEALEAKMDAKDAEPAPAAASVPIPAKPVDPPPALPEALQAPEPGPAVDNFTPFAFADFGWMNGTSRATSPIFDTKFFTPEIRFDTYFTDDFDHPIDHTMGGSSEEFRSGEFQLEQASVGGDFHWHDARGRVIFMDGMFATTTPRNDASAGVGGWDIDSAYKYVSEAYGGYHFNYLHGVNVDAGIFVSYIGLFSYYNFDNWAYQPSYVSSNTPWFFNGMRIQIFATNKLKIEPWIINGWQSYNKYNARLGLGGQILWRPTAWLGFVFNNYGNGTDNLGEPEISRIHTDDSFLIRYYNHPDSKGLSKMAMSFTGDLGCQYGPGVSCFNSRNAPKDSFAGWMAYNRWWFDKDQFALTLGGGAMDNPGRYLTLLPPINQATAVSGTPYFTENPGNVARMYDSTATFQWMPRTWATWWFEGSYRHSNVPYWTGRGGITPPGGYNGSPANYVCTNGSTNFADTFLLPSSNGFLSDNGGGSNTNGAVDQSCAKQAFASVGYAGMGPWYAWAPDLRKVQSLLGIGIMIKF